MTGPLDLGTLAARVRVDATGVKSSLGSVKRDLTDVKKEMEGTEQAGQNMDINKKMSGNVARTAQEARKLGDDLEAAGRAGRDMEVSRQPAEELDRASSSAKTLGDRLGSATGKVLKWSAAAAGTAVLGTVGASIAKGFSRINAIDQATAKLEALGNSGSDVQAIMDNALASVKGTAFGIGEAAGTAATMVASGVEPGQELESVLRGVADSAAIAGSGMDEMGLIWGKVAAKGKLDGETMAQMLERQIPIYDILSEKLGVASEDIADMVSEGEVSFEEFSSAMNDYVGGGAVRMGETFSGSVDNMGAALGRLGAAIVEPAFEAAPDVIGTITEQLDGATEAVGPLAEEWSERLVPVVSNAATSVIPAAGQALEMLGDGFDAVAPLVKDVAGAISDIPFPILAAGIAGVTAQQTGLTGALSTGTGKAKEYAGVVGSTLGNVLTNAGNAYRRGAGGLKEVAAGHRTASDAAKVQAINTRDSFTSIDYMGSAMASGFKGHMASMAGSAKGFATGGLSVIRDGMGGVVRAGQGLMGALGGPWGIAISGAAAAVGLLVTQHREAKRAEEEHAAQQDALRDTLDQTTGAISEQTRELQARTLQESGAVDTARELGVAQNTVVDAAMGNKDAQNELRAAMELANLEAVKSSDAWAKNRENFENAGVSAEDLAAAVGGNEEAMRKVNEAASEYSTAAGPGLMSQFMGIKRDAEGATEGVGELGDSVFGAAQDLEALQAETEQIALENFEGNARKTAEAMGILGDSITGIPDDKTITVDSLSTAAKEELDAIGVEVERIPNSKEVKVTLPDGGVNILEALRLMDADIRQIPGTKEITLEDNTPEVQQRLIDLKLATRDDVTGEVRLNDNIADVISKQIELGAAVTDHEGNVHIDDNTGEVLAGLDSLGFASQMLPPGHVRITDDTEENRANLEELGIEATLLPGGHLAITDTSDDTLARLGELGTTTENLPPGYIQITDGSDENRARLKKLGIDTERLPNGEVVITDNAAETQRHIKTTLSKENTNTFSDHVINITRKITDIFTSENANGNYYAPVQQFADGGVDRAVQRRMRGEHEPAHTAHIAPAGAYRVFAEPETGGEAYIPLAESKRGRSERILAQVASKFGYQLTDSEGNVRAFANGGVVDSITGLVNRHFPEMQITSTYRNTNDLHGQGKAVDVSNGFDTTPEMQALSRWFYQNFKNQLAELIHWPLNGWQNVDEGRDFDFGPATNAEHRNHVHIAAHQPLRDPVPVGNAGLSDLSELAGAVGVPGGAYQSTVDALTPTTGATTTSTTTEPERELHGGAGTLFRDGSFLELMAAIYSKQTGTPMDDDIVSWGQAIGLYSKVAERDQEQAAKDREKNAEKIESTADKLNDARDQLPLDEEALRIQRMKRDETYNKRDKDGNLTATAVQKAQADQSVVKAEQKVEDTKEKIAELEDEMAQLERAQQELLVPLEGLDNIGGTSGNRYADAIIKEGKRRGITDRGIQIALATALVESGMKMYANPADPESFNYAHDAVGHDHDSVGLFQQRANGAWGTTADRMDPAKSAGMFYDKLDDADYNSGDPGAHAQRVQASAFPGRYAQRMGEAQQILDRYNSGRNAQITVTPMANGGILDNARQAQIGNGTSAVLWQEAGPEAYIPLSSDKRARSLDIWAETGKRLGVDVMSLLNLIGSGLPGLVEGQLNFNTGSTTSLERLGLNPDAASYRGAHEVANAVGAVFNGPVQINDPREYLRSQLGNAGRDLGIAMRSMNI